MIIILKENETVSAETVMSSDLVLKRNESGNITVLKNRYNGITGNTIAPFEILNDLIEGVLDGI
jgi:hypothetical protein